MTTQEFIEHINKMLYDQIEAIEAHQETPAPVDDQPLMVATEAGTQYSFDVAPDTQLALF